MRASRPALSVLVGAAGFALVAALAGCSAASAPASHSPAPTSGAGGTTSASSTSSSSGGGSSTSLDKICSLLTADEVNESFPNTFASAKDSVDPSTGDHLCTYTSADGATVVVVGLVSAGRTTYDQLAANADSRLDEDQVGDHSSYQVGGKEFDFQTGDQVFYVKSTGSADAGILLGGMGEAVVSQLGR